VDDSITPAALSWLCAVLAERFGQPFRLQAEEGPRLRLFLQGSDRSITTIADPQTFARNDSELAFTDWDARAEGWHFPIDSRIPAPGANRLPSPLITPSVDGYHINYDILGLTFWMLTRQEEIGRTDLDDHGRFPATASHAFKHGYLERPIVDEWLAILRQVIKHTWPGIALAQHQFRVRLSHDVDRPSRYGFGGIKHLLRTVGGDVLKRRELFSLLHGPVAWKMAPAALHSLDPYNTFDWIMDLSEANNLQSAFYFICGRTNSKYDSNYEIEDPAIRSLLRSISSRGHEIGLHPSYETYLNANALKQEAERLLRVCQEEGIAQSQWGGRMHYLRWSHPTTLKAWARAGMNYDSTLGYADRPGFRCGTCFEYPAYDPLEKKILDIRIRPLVVMEGTVIAKSYLGLGWGKDAEREFIALKDNCRRVNGLFTILWHNSELRSKEALNLYERIVSS